MKLEVTLSHSEVENIVAGACRASGYDVNSMMLMEDGYLMTYVPEKNGHVPSRLARLKAWLVNSSRLRAETK